MQQKQSESIIAQAAEAIIIRHEGIVIKRRIKKSYRIKEIDERLRRQRTRKEAKLIEHASALINVPKLIKVDEAGKEIAMEFIEGKKLSDFLDSFDAERQKSISEQIGKDIARLHDANIIHGDLTTSNMILKENNDNEKGNDKIANNKIFFIDFGLGFNSERAEDKAVDLHLLRQALEAKHFQHWHALFDAVLKGYGESKNAGKTLLQLQKVEKRGRYRKNAQ